MAVRTLKLEILKPHEFKLALNKAWEGKPKPMWWQYFGVAPSAFTLKDTVYTTRKGWLNQKLMAHEYGHWLEVPRLPWYQRIFDVSGCFSLRITDRYNLLETSWHWRMK